MAIQGNFSVREPSKSIGVDLVKSKRAIPTLIYRGLGKIYNYLCPHCEEVKRVTVNDLDIILRGGEVKRSCSKGAKKSFMLYLK